MSYPFETYKPRKIEFEQIVNIDNCKIKIYTITNRLHFESTQVLKNTLSKLSNWVLYIKNSNLPTYNLAFLIIHEAREGVLILLNWWTGENMIETKVYFADFNNPDEINIYPYHPKSLICIWELEIFAHERRTWIEHVLLQANNPDFENYLNDTLTKI